MRTPAEFSRLIEAIFETTPAEREEGKTRDRAKARKDALPYGSWRLIVFVKPLWEMLREEWEAQGRPTAGKVCPPRRASGSGLLALNTLQTRVQERWGELGHEPIGLHEARHTTATWLDHAGVSPKVISEFMGHKTPEYQLGAARITLQRYTHILPGELERARVLFDKFLVERAEEDDPNRDPALATR